MAADHVLAFEVVLANGDFVSANAHENADIFWALRGGGGGTFGVVTTVIVKAYPDVPVSTSSFTYTTATGISRESFWAGFKVFFDSFPKFAREGIYAYFFIWPDLPAAGELLFSMQPFFAPDKTMTEWEDLLRPWFSELQFSINTTISHFSTFYEAWNSSFSPEGLLPPYTMVASRLWPASNWNDETIANTTFAEIRNTAEDGHMTFGYNIAGSWAQQGTDDNAVNSAWRETVSHMMSGVAWPLNASSADQLAIRKNFTYGHMQKWHDLSPGAGAYMNEADRIEPDFQWSFFGDKYPRLLKLKKRYDPHNVFWAATAVGSEFFEVRNIDGLPNENGRLCKKANPDLYASQA